MEVFSHGQAEGAAEYQTLKEEEDTLDRTLSSKKLGDFLAQRHELSSDLARARGAEQALVLAMARLEERRERARERRDEVAERSGFLVVDECAAKPCKNDGSCLLGVDGFICDCNKGFSGETCETGEETLI